MNEQSLSRGLSFFSLGLGLAELLAPRHVARFIGVNDNHDTLIRLLGLREISSGLGIMQGRSGYFLWSRVAGDVMDLGLLAAAMRSTNNDRQRLNLATAAVAGVTVLDVLASILTSRDHAEPGWRTNATDHYSAGFERGDPRELRAWCDDAMASHHSADAFAPQGTPQFERLPPGGDPLDELAGHDDGLEQAEPPGRSGTP